MDNSNIRIKFRINIDLISLQRDLLLVPSLLIIDWEQKDFFAPFAEVKDPSMMNRNVKIFLNFKTNIWNIKFIFFFWDED